MNDPYYEAQKVKRAALNTPPTRPCECEPDDIGKECCCEINCWSCNNRKTHTTECQQHHNLNIQAEQNTLLITCTRCDHTETISSPVILSTLATNKILWKLGCKGKFE